MDSLSFPVAAHGLKAFMDMNVEPVVQRLKELAASPELHDVEEIIMTSRDFWDVADDDDQERVEAKFIRHYQTIVTELTRTWAEPSFEGNWQNEGFPEWAAMENMPLAF